MSRPRDRRGRYTPRVDPQDIIRLKRMADPPGSAEIALRLGVTRRYVDIVWARWRRENAVPTPRPQEWSHEKVLDVVREWVAWAGRFPRWDEWRSEGAARRLPYQSIAWKYGWTIGQLKEQLAKEGVWQPPDTDSQTEW